MVDFDKIVDFVNNVYGSNEGLAKMTLLEMGIDPATRRPTQRAADLRHTCGDCGKELQIVRPGKYQCVNPKCGASR